MASTENRGNPAYSLSDHPLRASLSAEMHVRKLPPLRPPMSMMQLVMSNSPESYALELAMIEKFAPCPAAEARPQFLSFAWNGLRVIWERHSEVSSFAFIAERVADMPFDGSAFDAIPREWLTALPGQVIRATRLAFISDASEALIEQSFNIEDLVDCEIDDGAARIISDFRLHADGFGRLLIVDQGINPFEASVAVQRVQELGNYRNLALLGLPDAQSGTSAVHALEKRLADLTSAIASSVTQDGELLQELTLVSADLGKLNAATRFRMSATRAYSQIVEERLTSLRIRRFPGRQTLEDFTQRRLRPAVRTCSSFVSRLDELTKRAAWTTELLRTRVDNELSRQNRDLLATMNRRTGLQLRLQHTVEGLSVAGISYYVVNLIAELLRGGAGFLAISAEHIQAAIVLPVVASVWFVTRHKRRVAETKVD